MNLLHNQHIDRRDFLNKTTLGLGSVALASLLGPSKLFGKAGPITGGDHGIINNLHFAPKAKRVIYLFQSGGPSQLETFDYKPTLAERVG